MVRGSHNSKADQGISLATLQHVAGRLLRIAAVLSCTALAFIVILNFLGHMLLYHPRPYGADYQRLLSTGVFELQFKTSAGRQTAFYIPPHSGSGVPDRIWVAFCGNGSLALDRLPLTARESNPRRCLLACRLSRLRKERRLAQYREHAIRRRWGAGRFGRSAWGGADNTGAAAGLQSVIRSARRPRSISRAVTRRCIGSFCSRHLPVCAMKRPSSSARSFPHLLGRKLRQPCGLAPPRTKPATAARRDLSWTSGRHHSVRHGSRISGGVSRFCYLPRNSGNRSQYGGRRGGGGNPRVSWLMMRKSGSGGNT